MKKYTQKHNNNLN